ncbi:CrcB protein [Gordonia malaquae]|uniref:Fluoride-specific ion channel FluC n=1 Tax=Gordonia malaquae NBRC 108250 TaxID=1223542 RepID=M3VBT1_GORML|nr:CrcB family protein [Gordonia malaquae]GAC80803.1 protein CrcB homolog [Gordonia malaquae NBRC 108250]SEB69715.1 CrcB protein [Gordonia malaquae]
MIPILTFLAGAVGAVLRFLVDDACRRRWPGAFPGPTFAINVTGSLAMGLIAGMVMFHGADHDWQTVIGTGFLGGYTTFSTSVLETVRTGGRRGLVYAVLTLGGSVGACAVGLAVTYVG